ncbi:unnamed protein product, partial [Rotaria sp. Silwood1]
MAVHYSGISGQITHGDDKVYDACRYYGALIVAAMSGAQKNELTSKTFYDDHLEWFGDRILHSEIMAIAQGSYQRPGGYQDGIRGKGYIVNALEAALWAFWSDEGSFEKGVLNAVNLGDDTDTTAAIYGQLAGAHYGYNKLPEKWVECIYAKDFIGCVSSWIAYEGEKWFRNQTMPYTSELINSSNGMSLNSKASVSIYWTQNSCISLKTSLGRDISSNTIVRKAINPSGRIGHLNDEEHHFIRIGNNDPNEDYDHPGQSITQRSTKAAQVPHQGYPSSTSYPPFRRDYFICTGCGAYSTGGVYSSVCDDCNGVTSDPPRNTRHHYLCTQCAQRRPTCTCNIAGVIVAAAVHILVHAYVVASFANVYRLLVHVTNLVAIAPV